MCVPDASSEVTNADVDVLNVHIINNALGYTCSLAREGAGELRGTRRLNSINSLTIHPYGVRLRHLVAQMGGEVVTIYQIILGQLSCQNCVYLRWPSVLITVL